MRIKVWNTIFKKLKKVEQGENVEEKVRKEYGKENHKKKSTE